MNALVLVLLAGVEVSGAGQVGAFPLTAGGFVRGTVGLEIWGDDAHGGRLEAGVQIGFDGQDFQWLGSLGAGEQLTGSERRTHLWLVAGHTAHRGRFSLGVHAVGGLSHQALSGTFTNAAEGISGPYAASNVLFAFGLTFRGAAQIGERWGLALQVSGFPLASTWPATGYFGVGFGPFVRF